MYFSSFLSSGLESVGFFLEICKYNLSRDNLPLSLSLSLYLSYTTQFFLYLLFSRGLCRYLTCLVNWMILNTHGICGPYGPCVKRLGFPASRIGGSMAAPRCSGLVNLSNGCSLVNVTSY